jgi:hypothetical protein
MLAASETIAPSSALNRSMCARSSRANDDFVRPNWAPRPLEVASASAGRRPLLLGSGWLVRANLVPV